MQMRMLISMVLLELRFIPERTRLRLINGVNLSIECGASCYLSHLIAELQWQTNIRIST